MPDVIAVGHTDTSGNATSNFELGLRRATIVRSLLVADGLTPALIEVTSHGESNPLVRDRRRDARAAQQTRGNRGQVNAMPRVVGAPRRRIVVDARSCTSLS